jgi:hypothetical protein
VTAVTERAKCAVPEARQCRHHCLIVLFSQLYSVSVDAVKRAAPVVDFSRVTPHKPVLHESADPGLVGVYNLEQPTESYAGRTHVPIERSFDKVALRPRRTVTMEKQASRESVQHQMWKASGPKVLDRVWGFREPAPKGFSLLASQIYDANPDAVTPRARAADFSTSLPRDPEPKVRSSAHVCPTFPTPTISTLQKHRIPLTHAAPKRTLPKPNLSDASDVGAVSATQADMHSAAAAGQVCAVTLRTVQTLMIPVCRWRTVQFVRLDSCEHGLNVSEQRWKHNTSNHLLCF